MAYKDLIDRHTKETNKFTDDEKIIIMFGSSENEILKQIKEKNLNPNDLINLGAGVWLKKDYENEFNELVKRHRKERKEYLLANVYEVVNYYYWDYEVYISINYDYDNILTELLEMTPQEIEANKDEIKRAREDYIREFEKLNI